MHYRILTIYLSASMSVLRRALILSLVSHYSINVPFQKKRKKKGGKEGLHTQAANVTPPLPSARPCLLLLPVGALPADRVELRTVSAFGRFLA